MTISTSSSVLLQYGYSFYREIKIEVFTFLTAEVWLTSSQLKTDFLSCSESLLHRYCSPKVTTTPNSLPSRKLRAFVPTALFHIPERTIQSSPLGKNICKLFSFEKRRPPSSDYSFREWPLNRVLPSGTGNFFPDERSTFSTSTDVCQSSKGRNGQDAPPPSHWKYISGYLFIIYSTSTFISPLDCSFPISI